MAFFELLQTAIQPADRVTSQYNLAVASPLSQNPSVCKSVGSLGIENPTDNQQQNDLNPDKAGHERVVTASQMIGSIVHHDFFPDSNWAIRDGST